MAKRELRSMNQGSLSELLGDITHQDITRQPEKMDRLIPAAQEKALSEISALDLELYNHFQDRIILNPALSRKVVSFQANKEAPVYRWYKYKEAFSADLVVYLLRQYGVTSGRLLDPFAGMGTALFAAGEGGLDADGIELLPIGQQIIDTRLLLERMFTDIDFLALQSWTDECPWRQCSQKIPLNKLRITDGAYPDETLDAIERYMEAMQFENENVKAVLRFALLCILESVSYTRKDGQYLRWDYRSGRQHGEKPFKKGHILDFDQAICEKLKEIVADSKMPGKTDTLFSTERYLHDIHLFHGSCLDVMPTLPGNTYSAVMTSPPYCNRYDYTRTYALELALLGSGEKEISELRQRMLTCTVENRGKDLLSINDAWKNVIEAVDSQELLQAILDYLEKQKEKGALNNNGIPRMVRGYFYEMACIIAECARVMKKNARMFMVNDNVRYAGASISVDIILSSIAEKLGFKVENISVLPNGKGNSSQQMGVHGRDPLRKCVYVWRKAD